MENTCHLEPCKLVNSASVQRMAFMSFLELLFPGSHAKILSYTAEKMVILRPGGHVREPCTFIQIIVDVFLTHSQGIQLPPFDVGHETLKRSKGTEDMHMFSARVRAPEVFATNCPTRQNL